jgi:hypothetical protein
LSAKVNRPVFPRRLKRHAIDALLKGRYGNVGGKTIAIRGKNLVKIAASYSLDELLDEPGVGRITALEIQLWLEERGASLRSTRLNVDV